VFTAPNLQLLFTPRNLRQSHKSFAHAKSSACLNSFAEHSAARCEDNDGRAVFEPAHLFALAKSCVVREIGGFARIEYRIGKAQANAGNENRGHRNKHDELISGCEARADNDALVAAEKLLDPRQGSRVEVPCVTPDVRHALDATIVRSMKAMIHAGGQTQGGVATVTIEFGQRPVAEKFLKRIGRAFHLQQIATYNAATATDNSVAGSDQDIWVLIYRTRTLPQLSNETIAQAGEMRLFCVAQIEIGEKAPDGNGDITYERLLDGAKPAHQTRGEAPRNAIGKDEIQAFLLAEMGDNGSRAHIQASGIK